MRLSRVVNDQGIITLLPAGSCASKMMSLKSLDQYTSGSRDAPYRVAGPIKTSRKSGFLAVSRGRHVPIEAI